MWLACVALRSLLPCDRYCWKNKQPYLLVCFFFEQLCWILLVLEDPYIWFTVLFPAQMQRFKVLHLCGCYTQTLMQHECILSAYLCTKRQEPCFERLSEYAKSIENISFIRPIIHATSHWSSHTNIQGHFILTWRSCFISFCTTSMFSGAIINFVRPEQNLFWIEHWPC